VIEALLIVVGLAIAAGVGFGIARRHLAGSRRARVHHILLPFTGNAISRRAVDAALRLARAENAILMPAYLAIVPLHLPLDTPLPKEASGATGLLEAIEQRAAAQGVPVDSRIERGRSYRHALLRLLEEETFDRVVVPATALPRVGFSGEDLVWLLEQAPAEVVILRPSPDDTRVISGNGGRRNGGGRQNGARPAGLARYGPMR
jgi:nucleotide-binding universal stress UspA family protein